MVKRIVLMLCAGVCGLCLNAQSLRGYLNRPLPQGWAEDTDVFLQTMPVEDRWWQLFGDPTLDSLIAVASQANYSLEEALLRMEQARLSLQVERGAFAPTLNIGGGWTRQQTSGNTGSTQGWAGAYNLTATMSWEIDLAGRIRHRVKAQRESYLASQEEVCGVMVSLCAQVATAYFTLRQYQQELEVLDHNCESQRSVVAITEARYKSGLASKLDVAQARSVYYGTLAQVPSMEANITQTMNTLAVLLGDYPMDIVPGVGGMRPLPQYIEPVGVDVPASLLRRRPDIRQAERQVNAQAALLGASKAEWLPQFFISGSFGYTSRDFNKLMRSGSMTWEIAPSFSWTLFNGGQRYNNVRIARIELDEAVSQYNQTVLQAMKEVHNAMDAYSNSVKQIVATRQAFTQSEQALALSLDLYKQGLSPFQNVLDAQRSLLSYEESLVQAQAYSLICLVQMYQALGGGVCQ